MRFGVPELDRKLDEMSAQVVARLGQEAYAGAVTRAEAQAKRWKVGENASNKARMMSCALVNELTWLLEPDSRSGGIGSWSLVVPEVDDAGSR